MDPANALGQLISVARYLHSQSEKVKQNKEECQRLAGHATTLHSLILDQEGLLIPEDLAKRLNDLSRYGPSLNLHGDRAQFLGTECSQKSVECSRDSSVSHT